MANTYLTRSLASTNTSWTFSAWVKRSGITATNYLISWGNSGTDATGIGFASSDELFYYSEDGGDNKQRKTSAKYRDTNAFYHIVCKCDANAITLYVNGEEPTQSWTVGSSANPLDTSTMAIGKWVTSAYYHNGSMSHIHFIDGTAYDATAFGQYDANGVWTIKTTITPSSGWGTNGYWILKDGNSVTDQSGQGNNWTVGGGTLTNTEDSPSNVFATFNTLIKNHGATFTNGNLTYQSPASNPVFGSLSTLGMSSGKFYAECKYSAGSNHYLILGIADNNFNPNASTPDDLGKSGTTESIAYVVNTGAYRVNNSNTSWGSAGGDGDIIQIAVDCDNNKIFFGVNGTWGASSNPATGSNGIDVSSVLTGDTWFFGVSNDTSGTETIAQFNFGNGYFGTTAVSSAGTNASGIGIFEYDVPTGFTALSTKGLNL